MCIEYVNCECLECRFHHQLKGSVRGWVCGVGHMKDCTKSPVHTIKDYSSIKKDKSRR